MKNEEPLLEIARQLGLKAEGSGMKDKLAERINELLDKHFDHLISILYRMDVSEMRLRQMLASQPGKNAGMIIAELMIERQAEKIKSRREHQRDNTISDEEKW